MERERKTETVDNAHHRSRHIQAASKPAPEPQGGWLNSLSTVRVWPWIAVIRFNASRYRDWQGQKPSLPATISKT